MNHECAVRHITLFTPSCTWALTIWSLVMRSFGTLAHLNVRKPIVALPTTRWASTSLAHCSLIACRTCAVILLIAFTSIGWTSLGRRANCLGLGDPSLTEVIVIVITILAILVAICTVVMLRWYPALAWQRWCFGWPDRFTGSLNDLLTSVLPFLGEWPLDVRASEQAIPRIVASIFDCIDWVTSGADYMLQVLLLQGRRAIWTISIAITRHVILLSFNSWHH